MSNLYQRPWRLEYRLELTGLHPDQDFEFPWHVWSTYESKERATEWEKKMTFCFGVGYSFRVVERQARSADRHASPSSESTCP